MDNGGGIPFLKKVEYFCFFPPFHLNYIYAHHPLHLLLCPYVIHQLPIKHFFTPLSLSLSFSFLCGFPHPWDECILYMLN